MHAQKISIQNGLWPSPLSPKAMAQSLRLEDVLWDDEENTLVWLEGRSNDGVLVALAEGSYASKDLTAALSVRAKVGYGGGDFTVSGGCVYFSASDGRLYRQSLQYGMATSITPPYGSAASPKASPNGEFLLYVHSDGKTDCLGIVDVHGQCWPQKLVEGSDFYMHPRWHPSGQRIAFVAWNHPHMPWDQTQLVLAQVELKGNFPHVVQQQSLVAEKNVSIFQPEFSPDGHYLAYISDQDGWWRLYLHDLKADTAQAISPENVEVGIPAWKQEMRVYGFARGGHTVFYLENDRGFWSLKSYDVQNKTTQEHEALNPYTHLSQIHVSSQTDQIAVFGSSSQQPTRLLRYDAATREVTAIKRSTGEFLSSELFSTPAPISWTVDDDESHGLFYEPTNPSVSGIGLPPLVVLVHGGPTSQRNAAFDDGVQFLTTRGYAVLQVNHRGSTGYGRAYRDALKGQWGVFDVEDCISAVKFLSEQGKVDGKKCVIMGGSAGGYTVLQALVHHPGVFRAGVCLFGISNLFTLVADTHKFEARYIDSLIGPLPEASVLYRERSPLFFADQINDPLAIFQGAEDRVVPRSQSDDIVASLKRRGVPHEYHAYEGEGHGWRKRETIETFYEQLDSFLRQYVIYAA